MRKNLKRLFYLLVLVGVVSCQEDDYISIERENKIIVEKSKSYLESQLTKLNGADSKVGALKNVLWNEPDFISKNSINHDANNFTVAYPLKDSDTLFFRKVII